MTEAFVAIRFALATVFIAAALAKVQDRQRFTRAARDFGLLPPVLTRSIGVWLPRVELMAGLLMLAGVATAWVAVGMLTLLLMFTAGAIANLVRGNRPSCACFGSSSNRPIGPATVVRNTVLMALAAALAVARPDGPFWDPGTRLGLPTLAVAFLMANGVVLMTAALTNGLRIWSASNAVSATAKEMS